jgi:hypothetical protein
MKLKKACTNLSVLAVSAKLGLLLMRNRGNYSLLRAW